MFNDLGHIENIFSSAGGGGSGGGSGGSGLILIGYAPMHLIGAYVRKKKNKESEWVIGQVIGWVVCAVFTLGLLISSLYVHLFFISAIAAPIGMGAGLYNWFGKLRKNKKVEQQLQQISQNDSSWNEDFILTSAKNIFLNYQKDWTDYNTESMKSYMTPEYQYHAALMVYALQLASRKNNVVNPVVLDAVITNLNDLDGEDKDSVIVGITANAHDQIVDTRTNTLLYFSKKDFTEYWTFKRINNNWFLDSIRPSTANDINGNIELKQFATAHGYYYSLDWGYLLLPSQGQLFGEGKFGVSDINNHIIGMYNKTLVQIYSYTPALVTSNSYLIAQAYLPKSYGDIVVRHKSGLHIFGIKGLNRVSMEWGRFNEKYEVFASNVEQVTSFELLNPTFMEQLEALPFEVNIEVVDNVVYLYAPENTAHLSGSRYETMLQILEQAFKEMKL